jgi:LAGLIDADG-like domain
MAQPPGLSCPVSHGLGAIPDVQHDHPDTALCLSAPLPGAGLAQGTRLATARGLLPVEQLVPGDAVSLEDDRLARVAAVVPCDVQPTVRLRVQGGYELLAAPTHAVRTLTPQGDDDWRCLADLRRGDVVVLQPGRGLPPDLPYQPLPPCHSHHGHNHQEVRTPPVAAEAFAFFVGYVIGNGCLTRRGTLGWSVNLRDLAVADALAALVDRLFGLPVYPRPPHNGAQDSHLHRVPLLAWLRALGVAKDRVPDFLWQSRASVVAAFLRGYFAADGWATDGETSRVSIASSRPRLIAEVQALLLALGIPATRQQQTGVGPGKRHTASIVSVVAAGLPAFARQIGFAVPRRQAKLEALRRRRTGRQVFGGPPHLGDKVRALGLSGRVRQLLNTTRSRGRPVSPALAARVAALDPSFVAPLGLPRILAYGQLFLRGQAVTPAEPCATVAVAVRGARTCVSGGFLSSCPPG